MDDRQQWKLRGPVHTLRIESAEWDQARSDWGTPRHVSVITFRPDGAVEQREDRNPDGSTSRSVLLYDAASRRIETQWWWNGALTSRPLDAFDDRGRPVRTVSVDPDGSRREQKTCSYDEHGRKTTVEFLATHRSEPTQACMVEGTDQGYGTMGAETVTVVHDERGQPVEALFHDANHILLHRVTYERDRDGRLVREEWHQTGDVPFPELRTALEKATPNEQAQVLATLQAVFADRTFTSTTYAYDAQGRLLDRRQRMGALSDERTTFRYDDRDNPIEQTDENLHHGVGVDDQGTVTESPEESHVSHTRYEYRYDARANWTERIVSQRVEPATEFVRTNVERRTIGYYG